MRETLNVPKRPFDISWQDHSQGCHPISLFLVAELGETVLPIDILLLSPM